MRISVVLIFCYFSYLLFLNGQTISQPSQRHSLSASLPQKTIENVSILQPQALKMKQNRKKWLFLCRIISVHWYRFSEMLLSCNKILTYCYAFTSALLPVFPRQFRRFSISNIAIFFMCKNTQVGRALCQVLF